jgi:hypothetical protein
MQWTDHVHYVISYDKQAEPQILKNEVDSILLKEI